MTYSDVFRRCRTKFKPVVTRQSEWRSCGPQLSDRLSTETHEGNYVAETSLRCQQSLIDARDCLQRVVLLADSSGGEELIAHELRLGLDELGKVVGAIYTDDILDRVFSRFCIGK